MYYMLFYCLLKWSQKNKAFSRRNEVSVLSAALRSKDCFSSFIGNLLRPSTTILFHTRWVLEAGRLSLTIPENYDFTQIRTFLVFLVCMIVFSLFRRNLSNHCLLYSTWRLKKKKKGVKTFCFFRWENVQTKLHQCIKFPGAAVTKDHRASGLNNRNWLSEFRSLEGARPTFQQGAVPAESLEGASALDLSPSCQWFGSPLAFRGLSTYQFHGLQHHLVSPPPSAGLCPPFPLLYQDSRHIRGRVHPKDLIIYICDGPK